MAIPNETRRAGPYEGNGVTTAFAYGFRIISASQLQVTKRVGVSTTTLVLGVDYTVSGVGASGGGSVTLVIAPAAGEFIAILRVVPLTQEKVLENQGAYYPKTVEEALDLSAMRDQQIADGAARAIHVSEEEDPDGMQLPPATDRIGMVLGFDGDGLPEMRAPTEATGAIVDQPTAEEGINNTKLMTPLRVAQLFDVRRRAEYISPFDYVALAQQPDIVAGESTYDAGADLSAWLSACAAEQRKGGAIQGLFNVSAVSATITKSLIIEGRPGFQIKGDAATLGPILVIDGAADRPSVKVCDVLIDNSLRAFVAAAESGTALSLKRLGRFLVEGSKFHSTDYRDEKGDSGIVVNQCTGGLITGCEFVGQPDLGVYVTGGPSTGESDDYGDIVVTGSTFYRCSAAGSSKRQARRVAFVNNRVIECRVGFFTAEAGPPQIDPGREMIVANNFFKRIGSRAFEARGPGRVIFAGNHVEDWGQDPEGGAEPSGHLFGSRMLGPGSIVANNIFRFRDWSGVGKVGIQTGQLVLDSGTYGGNGNVIDGNVVDGAETGIYEGAGGGNNYGSNQFPNVTTPWVKAAGSTSAYAMRTSAGWAWGKTSPTSINQIGVGAGIDGLLTAARSAGLVVQFNRQTSFGDVVAFYKDGTQYGSIQIGDATTGAFFVGGLRPPAFTVATAPNAALWARLIIYVSDGNGGSPCYAFSDGTNWRRLHAPTTNISAT